MTKEEKIEQIHQQLEVHFETARMHMHDAKKSPMSSRGLLADAKEIVTLAAVLYALHHIDAEKPAVEAKLWEWVVVEAKPMTYEAEVEGTSLSMRVVERYGKWLWSLSDDTLVTEGMSDDSDAGIRDAEEALKEYTGVQNHGEDDH